MFAWKAWVSGLHSWHTNNPAVLFYQKSRADTHFFYISIKEAVAEAVVEKQDAGEVTGEVIKLLDVCRSEKSRMQMQKALGLKAEENFRKLYLEPALKVGIIEMTIPDKPRSSRQKYRLTEKGRELLKTYMNA